MSGYILSPDADQDLTDIWDYIAADSIDAADRWMKGEIGDDAAIDEMAGKFAALVELWLSLERR